MNQEEITKYIIEAREKKGITREQLAKSTGLTYNFIRMFEKGGNISIANLLRIVDCLDLSLLVYSKKKE